MILGDHLPKPVVGPENLIDYGGRPGVLVTGNRFEQTLGIECIANMPDRVIHELSHWLLWVAPSVPSTGRFRTACSFPSGICIVMTISEKNNEAGEIVKGCHRSLASSDGLVRVP